MVLIMSAVMVFSQKNYNYRPNEATTMAELAGVYKYNNNTHAGGAALNIVQMYDWAHFGGGLSWTHDATFAGKVFGGANFWLGDFYAGVSADIGVAQIWRESWWQNTNTLDKYRVSSPAPNMTIGGTIRLGYNWGKIGISASVSYDRGFSYKRGENLGETWVHISTTEDKNIVSAKVAVCYAFNNFNILSGENPLEIGVSVGHSTFGTYFSTDLVKLQRIAWGVQQSYGGLVNFYIGNGNAEIGGKYMLNFYFGGSNDVFSMGLGAEAVMGQYNRSWSGMTQEKPDRFQAKFNNYAFGGRGALVAEPFALKFARFRASLYGSVGVAGWLPAKGVGNFGYEVSSTNAQFYWNCGLRCSLSL